VNAYRKGGGEAAVDGVAVGASVTLTIRATGVIGGTVSANGKPAEELTVSVSDPKEGFEREESFFRTGGRFTSPMTRVATRSSAPRPEGSRSTSFRSNGTARRTRSP